MLSRQGRGDLLEEKISSDFHLQGIPLLVSPLLLRSRGCGQIDMARMLVTNNRRWVEIREVKSRLNLHYSQRKRLMNSAHFLGSVFSLPVVLDYLFKSA